MFNQNFVRLPNVLWQPRIHGEKSLSHYNALVPKETLNFSKLDINAQSLYTPIWMCDQEPLFDSSWDIYKLRCKDLTELEFHNLIENTSIGQMMALFARTRGFPILCHSESNSQEVVDFESNFTITCYYWYHAFISQDWFRHWQHNQSLFTTDRSSNKFRFLLYARDFSGSRQYRKQVVQTLRHHRSQILFDWDETKHITPNYSAKIDVNDAEQSAVHLVLETLFDHNKIYLTEKIFKPMVMGQPFIIFGPPGSLKYLHRYGFKTFSECWPEDYDSEFDHDKRLAMILNLISWLVKLPQDDFQKTYLKCLATIEHNRRWFFSDQFTDLCWRELVTNFENAILQQKQWQSLYPEGQFCHFLSLHPEFLKIGIFRNVLTKIIHYSDPDTKKIIFQRCPIFTSL